MKTIAEQLRSEISQILSTSGPGPTAFPPELIERVVQYVRQQASKGVFRAQCSQELGLSEARLHYWLNVRHRKALLAPSKGPPPVLRPVQVSLEMVPVYDGVAERRYTVRSPAGWEVKYLTLKELGRGTFYLARGPACRIVAAMNYWRLAVLALTLSLGRNAHAAPPVMKTYDHRGFSLVVIDGNPTKMGGADQGMVKIVTAPLSQMLYWTVPAGSLRQRADHERSLIQQAAEGGPNQPEVSGYKESATPGKGSIGWTARIENTRFASTVIDCGKHHILLTTMGPTLGEVQSAHEVSIRSVRCK